MRSYDAARSLFGFLGFCAWCLIGIGILGAIAGAQFVGQAIGYGAGGLMAIAGMLPGAMISLVGFLALALVQNGRTSVDTAELTQQMLKVAREYLEVSRQSLKKAEQSARSYQALLSQKDGDDVAGSATKTKAPSPASFHAAPTATSEAEEPAALENSNTHGGKAISRSHYQKAAIRKLTTNGR